MTYLSICEGSRIPPEKAFIQMQDNDKKKLLLTLPGDGVVLLKIPENVGEEVDIQVKEYIDFVHDDEKYDSSKNTVKGLRKIFCKELSPKKGEPCYDFFETIQEVSSLEIQVGTTPDFFRLHYNEYGTLVCSPSLFSFAECLKKSRKLEFRYNDDRIMEEEFGKRIFHDNFKRIPVIDKSPERKKLFLKILYNDYHNRLFKISYPTLSKTNSYHHESQEITNNWLVTKNIGVLLFLPIPIVIDIVIFPVNLVYLVLWQWGKGFSSP
jgi:WD40 repeat protein